MRYIGRLLLLIIMSAGIFDPASAQDDQPGALLWELRVGGQIWGSLTHDGDTLYLGSDDQHLHALDIIDRKVKWSFRTEGKVRSKPAVAGDLVLFASDDGFLYAVERKSGRQRWRFDLKAKGLERRPPSPDTPFYDYLQSSPIVHDGRVYVGSLSGKLFAVELVSGREAWSIGVADAIRGTPAIHDGLIYFGGWDDFIYAVDLATHKLAWRADTGGIVQSTPAFGAGCVVVGSRSARLLAYDARSGTEVWRHDYKDGSWVESSAIHADGKFFVGSSDALKLSAFDAAGGKEIWAYDTGGWTWATPRLANGTLYVGALSAYPHYFEDVTLKAGFHAIDARTGKEKWRFVPDGVKGYVTGGVVSAPEIVDGVVYVGALDGHVYALKE